jgi:hypothetical protein
VSARLSRTASTATRARPPSCGKLCRRHSLRDHAVEGRELLAQGLLLLLALGARAAARAERRHELAPGVPQRLAAEHVELRDRRARVALAHERLRELVVVGLDRPALVEVVVAAQDRQRVADPPEPARRPSETLHAEGVRRGALQGHARRPVGAGVRGDGHGQRHGHRVSAAVA